MRSYNMHEAKTHLSRLVREAVDGDPFIIARAGKPLVRVTAVEDDEGGSDGRLGFLAGHITLPPDFDRMGRRKTEASFEGAS